MHCLGICSTPMTTRINNSRNKYMRKKINPIFMQYIYINNKYYGKLSKHINVQDIFCNFNVPVELNICMAWVFIFNNVYHTRWKLFLLQHYMCPCRLDPPIHKNCQISVSIKRNSIITVRFVLILSDMF